MEHAAFTKGLSKSEQEAQRFAKNTQGNFNSLDKVTGQVFSSMAKAVTGPIAAFMSVSAAIDLVSNSLNFADKINDVSKANEVAVGTVLNLTKALSLNGGEAENAGKLFASLTAKLDEAAGGSESAQAQFKKVGISLKDLATLDGEALFEKTLSGLTKLEDPVSRNATAMYLLGKSVKGVDIVGLGDDFANSKQSFDDVGEKFEAIGKAMDKIDESSAKLKTSIAVSIAPWYVATIDFLDKLITGYSTLEENIRKAHRAQTGDTSSWKATPKITDKPVFGAFNLPTEWQGGAAREVIDTAAENARKKALATADSLAKEAARKDKAARDQLNAEILKDIQNEINFEMDMDEAAYAAKQKAEKELYENKIKYLESIQDIANKNFEEAQQESQRLADDRLREFEKSMDGINQVFREGFANMVNGGKGTWKSFTQSLVTTFKTTVADTIYKMLAQPFVVKIVASLLGVGASGAASAAGGSAINSLTSGGSIFKTVTDGLQSLNTNIVGSIEKLGVFLSNGNGGLADTIGGYLGQNASTIAGALAFAPSIMSLLKGDIKSAAFQGAGAGIGLALGGPVGGAIGSFLGGAIGNLFGGGTPKLPRYYTTVSSSVKNGVLTNGKGVTGSDSKGVLPGTEAPLQQLNTAFAASLGGLLTSFGKQAEIAISSTIYKKNNSFGRFDFSLNGKKTNFYNEGKSDVNATFQTLVNTVLSSVLVNAIKSSNLSNGVKKFFDGVTDKTAISNTISGLINLKGALRDLPPVFDAIRNAIDTTAYKTDINTLTARFSAIGTYTSLFYTQAENLDLYTRQLTTQFSALNEVMPASREEYRRLVDSIKVVDKASSEQFHGLVALAPAMDAYYKQLENQKGMIDSLTDSLREANSFGTLVDFTRYQRVSDNFGTKFANNYVDNLPSFAVGSDFIPKNMTARVHAGERIVPAADNAAIISSLRGGNNQEVADLLRQLLTEVRASNLPLIQAMQKAAKVLTRIDDEGVIISETNNAGIRTVLDTRAVA